MAEILDLDALSPQDAQVKLGSKHYRVTPPSAATVFRLMKLGSDLAKSGGEAEKVDAIYQEQRTQIKSCIPDLDVESLTFGQLSGLTMWVMGLGTPKTDDLEQNGVSTTQAKKNRRRSKAG